MKKLVEDFAFKESLYKSDDRIWDATTLYKAAKDQKCRKYKFPLKYYDMCAGRFRHVYDVADMAHHVKRVLNADMDIPIVICPNGDVVDGYHRIVKALAMDIDHVMAYRLKEMPPHDRVEK